MYENISPHNKLDLSGFKFEKDMVSLEINQDRLTSDGSLLKFKAEVSKQASKGRMEILAASVPESAGRGPVAAAMQSASLSLGFKLARVPKNTTATLGGGWQSLTTRPKR